MLDRFSYELIDEYQIEITSYCNAACPQCPRNQSVGAEHVVAPEPRFETYRVSKAALAHASKQCTLAYKNNLVPFKTTLITLDRLDTELSRSRTNWTGNGIDCADVCRYIQFINQIQENTCVAETTLYVNYEYDGQK